MKPLKPCRIKLAYSTYRVGDIIYPTGVLRDQLKARGFIEVLEDEPQEQRIETATVETQTPEETLPVKRGRGRPRKLRE